MRIQLVLLLALLPAGCVFNHGPRADRLPPVRTASGVTASVELHGRASGRVVGELLEVRDSSLLMIWGQRVVEVPFTTVTRINIAGRLIRLGNDHVLSAADEEQLRLFSRHPRGMTPQLLEALLGGLGQEDVIRATSGGMRPGGQDEEIDVFITAARAGTAPYHDRARAIADGYRRIGPDSPGMGEHWINPALVTLGQLDPARPQILSYVPTAEGPRLIGVAYALALREGEVPPASAIPCTAWHAHTGTVADEALSLHSAAMNGAAPAHAGECDGGGHHHHGGAAAVRLATVHAWIWQDNPDGVFAPDNWSVPFVRQGIEPDPSGSTSAGRALALAAGDAGYFSSLLRTHARLSPSEAARAEEILGEAGRRVAAMMRNAPFDPLRAAIEWERAWQQIERRVSSKRRNDVRRVLVALGG
jgi:hypothetical protein